MNITKAVADLIDTMPVDGGLAHLFVEEEDQEKIKPRIVALVEAAVAAERERLAKKCELVEWLAGDDVISFRAKLVDAIRADA